jgi:hypothetical protein
MVRYAARFAAGRDRIQRDRSWFIVPPFDIHGIFMCRPSMILNIKLTNVGVVNAGFRAKDDPGPVAQKVAMTQGLSGGAG